MTTKEMMEVLKDIRVREDTRGGYALSDSEQKIITLALEKLKEANDYMEEAKHYRGECIEKNIVIERLQAEIALLKKRVDIKVIKDLIWDFFGGNIPNDKITRMVHTERLAQAIADKLGGTNG